MLLYRFFRRDRRVAMSIRALRSRAFDCLVPPTHQQPRRHFSCAASSCSQRSEEIPELEGKGTAVLLPHWLSDLKRRIGRCVLFGLRQEQVGRAGDILQVAGKEWRDLVVGSEGFLTGPGREGLKRHRVAWGEMDSMRHVNNVTYTRYAESARTNWVRNFAMHVDPEHKKEWCELLGPEGDGFILRSIRMDYKFPMTWPDRVSVYHKFRSPPTASMDSFILDVIILSERQQRASARCVEDIVMYDYRKCKKTPLKPFMAKAFKETFRLQEETKAKNTARVLDLLQRVESLERESWNNKDAKEDFGNQGL